MPSPVAEDMSNNKVIVDQKKYTYEQLPKYDGYIIHMKDYVDG